MCFIIFRVHSLRLDSPRHFYSPSSDCPPLRFGPHADHVLVINVSSVLFFSRLDLRVGHTMDVLSSFIPVLCHSD